MRSSGQDVPHHAASCPQDSLQSDIVQAHHICMLILEWEATRPTKHLGREEDVENEPYPNGTVTSLSRLAHNLTTRTVDFFYSIKR